MKWTTEQQQAISSRNCGLILSAAAGSGKTAVLVERLIQQLCDATHPISADRIIVVTFTNDAAMQIRKRLQVSLEEHLQKEPHNKWFRTQQLHLQYAKICTISSFCFDLIRDHATEIGLTSGFRILDETEYNLLCRKIIDIQINNWYETQPQEMELLWNAFCENNDTPIEELILEIHRFLASVPFREQWVRQAIEQLQIPWQESTYYRTFLTSIQEKLQQVQNLIAEALQYAQELYDGENKVFDWILEDEQFVQHWRHLLTNSETDSSFILQVMQDRITKRKSKRFPSKRNNMQNAFCYPIVKAKRDQYEGILKECFQMVSTILPYCASDLSAHQALVPILLKLEQEFDQALWKAKLEKNGLNFEDGERLALNLLANITVFTIQPSSLAKELSEYYQIIMVDEYQDSNNKQDYIFKLLSHNSYDGKTDTLTYGDNIFLVGDVKQSIYRFRLANPQNFLRAIQSSTPYQIQSKTPVQHIKLNQNFRSALPILNFVNTIFSNLMTPDCGDLYYDQQQYLMKGTSIYDDLPQSMQGVEVVFLSDSEDAMDQANYVAQQIELLLAQQTPVATAIGTRPCEPRDFCILVRNGEPGKAFVKALESRGIPVKGGEEKGYLQSQEISILLELLRVLDNPLLDTSLAAVLLSPMFLITADELSILRLADRENSLYAAMLQWISIHTNTKHAEEQVLLKKCTFFLETLRVLQTESVLLPLDFFIQKIYDTTDLLSVMQLYKDGDKKRANLQLLLQYAHQYEANGQDYEGGVSGFLQYLDRLSEKGGDLKQAKHASGMENTVSVTTMHKSKGLEYAFVFLGKTETRFSTQDSRKLIHLSDSGEIGLRLKDSESYTSSATLPYQMIYQQKKSQAYSEELRLLYVAMTRAKQKLYIPLLYSASVRKKLTTFASAIKKDGSLPVSLVQSADSMSHWIWLCLLQQYDIDLQQCLPDLPAQTWNVQRASLQIQYTDCRTAQDFTKISEKLPRATPLVNQSLLKKMQQWTSFQISTPEQLEPSQLSVSELTKKENATEQTPIYKRPSFLQEKTQLTGSERGTAMHTYLQYANFEQAAHDPKRELVNLIHRGYLTEKQGTFIVLSQIKHFFSSDLYHRIQNAKQVMREYKFLVRLGDLKISKEKARELNWNFHGETMLKGIADLVFQEKQQLIIVDYKTDALSSELQLINRYQNQLYLYRLAFQVFTKLPVKECWIYSTHLNRAIQVPMDIEEEK